MKTTVAHSRRLKPPQTGADSPDITARTVKDVASRAKGGEDAAALTVGGSEFFHAVPDDQVRNVLRALDNEARFNTVSLLRAEPMGVSELARRLGVSQPTATAYVHQLEEAGIISHRYERTPRGLEKVCYTIYDGINLRWTPPEERLEHGEYVLDVPIGHYTYIECGGRSFLADQAQIIASPDGVFRFFNPVRMSGELLVLGFGSVRYVFPYNLSGPDAARSLTLSMEVACAAEACPDGAALKLALNGFPLGPINVVPAREHFGQVPGAPWLPPDIPTCGSLLTIRVTHTLATVNSHPAGALTLKDLDLCPTRPVELSLEVEPGGVPNNGIVVFGRHFGRHRQDIRMTVQHDTRGENE